MKNMLRFLCLCLFVMPSLQLFSQGSVRGIVRSSETGEALIGASVVYAAGKGSVTDIEGHYTIKDLPDGEYEITASYVGSKPSVRKIKIAGKDIVLNFELASIELKEVEIIADIALSRETPVAFTNISSIKIAEESASRDLPMILNSTPGVYATEQGGGMGDSRINIRGFDQRNVAVMVDGVPVNDMENGQVYWSNWDGLSDITRSMQVQRGLGASKLAIQSVGGTINIITKGIDSKKGGFAKQEVGNNGMLKTSVGLNTGRMKGGWGVTAAGSYKRGDGWTDQTGFEAWSYFIKVQKQWGKHLISFSANGAPQVHQQRTARLPIAVYDAELARKLGINVDSVLDNTPNTTTTPFVNFTTAAQGPRGPRYNPAWANYTDENGNIQTLNPSTNYFHKPQINLSHFWNVNEKLTWSNVAYLSIGRGGGTAFVSTSNFKRDSLTGQFDLTKEYNINHSTINNIYDSTLNYSSPNNIIRASINNHYWYGVLSTVDYQPTANLSILGGLDLRSYVGSHYQEVRDLFGGDYTSDSKNELLPQPTFAGDPAFQNRKKFVGDKINYNNDGFVNWAGAFLQAEMKAGLLTFFVNTSFSYTGFKRVDYFRKKDLVLSDTTYIEELGYNSNGLDTVERDGKFYNLNSPEARYNTNDWKWLPGYTFKAGANYNINEFNNVFINAGILSIAPRYNLFYTNTSNIPFPDAKQQFIYAAEVGYGIKGRKHAANLNGYYTYWLNKPPQSFANIQYAGESYSYQLQGLTTLHTGFEIDFNGYILPKVTYEGTFSWGDWTHLSGGTAYLFDNLGDIADTLEISAEGVHVGDAAQVQGAAGIRYEPFKGFYMKLRGTYFDKNYANLDPTVLTPILNGAGVVTRDNSNKESWKLPAYYFLDFHFGYQFKIKKTVFNLNGSVINLLDRIYITDALNGYNFDATTALVYIAQGRRFNMGLKVSF